MREAVTILPDIRRAWQTWQDALSMLNFIDREFLDYAIFHLNASERRFVTLLQEARRNGITAWNEEQLRPPAADGLAETTSPPMQPEAGQVQPVRLAPPAREGEGIRV